MTNTQTHTTFQVNEGNETAEVYVWTGNDGLMVGFLTVAQGGGSFTGRLNDGTALSGRFTDPQTAAEALAKLATR